MFEQPDQAELLPLDHKPITPPRAGHDGEQVFAAMWEATMRPCVDTFGDDVDPLRDEVLAEFCKPVTQRHASVVASAVTWFGCNVGHATLHRAERWRREGGNTLFADDCYLVAWTLENRRRRCTNHGVRSVEYVLATPDLLKPVATANHSDLTALPELSADDLEVIDHLMMWLAETQGQKFLARCRAKLAGIEEEKRVLRDAEFVMRRNAEGSTS